MNSIDLIHCSNRTATGTLMTAQQIALVQKTWKLFRDINPSVIGDVFYGKLFAEMPALKKLFKNPMPGQSKKLTDMLSMMVGRLHNLPEITEDIQQMARRHTGYGVKQAHYKLVGDALLWTLEQGLGKDWNDEVKQAWESCYTVLSGIMIDAAGYH